MDSVSNLHDQVRGDMGVQGADARNLSSNESGTTPVRDSRGPNVKYAHKPSPADSTRDKNGGGANKPGGDQSRIMKGTCCSLERERVNMTC